MALTPLSSKFLVKTHTDTIIEEVQNLQSQGIKPRLVSVVASDNVGVAAYETMKANVAEKLGINYETLSLDSETSQEELETKIKELVDNPHVHGIMLGLPYFDHLDTERAMEIIPQNKEVDGIGSKNAGLLTIGFNSNAIIATTPSSCITLAETAIDDWEGKAVTVVGVGRTVGKFLIPLLENRGATVTGCNHLTPPKMLINSTQSSDVVFSAVGRAGLLDDRHLRDGHIVIDAGVSENQHGHLSGDVALDKIQHLDLTYTPPKGGVGPLTTRLLFKNLIQCIELQRQEQESVIQQESSLLVTIPSV